MSVNREFSFIQILIKERIFKMPYFYINKNAQETGEHEIHKSPCNWMPSENNKISLGWFNTFGEAKMEALKHFDNVDGCIHCCPEGHTK